MRIQLLANAVILCGVALIGCSKEAKPPSVPPAVVATQPEGRGVKPTPPPPPVGSTTPVKPPPADPPTKETAPPVVKGPSEKSKAAFAALTKLGCRPSGDNDSGWTVS